MTLSRLAILTWRAGLWAMLLMSGSLSAQMQRVRSESVLLPGDVAATRELQIVLRHIEREDWATAIEVLDQFELRYGGALVNVDSRRVLRGGLAAQSLRLQLPENAARLQQSRQDSIAAPLWERALQTGDHLLLQQILERGAASRFGGAAARMLAEHHWERGELDRAATYWAMLLAGSSLAGDQSATSEQGVPAINVGRPLALLSEDLSPWEVAARLLLAEAFEGDPLRTRQAFDRFRERYPAATGRLAGREGTLLPILQGELSLNHSMNSTAGSYGDLVIRAPLWRIPLHSRLPATAGAAGPTALRPSLPMVSPAIDMQRIYVQDARTLRALNLKDGQPAWPIGTDEDQGALTDVVAQEPQLQLPRVGDPRWAPSAASGRLVAVKGWPISYIAASEPRSLETRLECFDIGGQEGKLLWSRQQHEIFPDSAWRISGPPLATAFRVYIAARRTRPDVAIGVACLDAVTGQPVWFQTVCGLLTTPPVMVHVTTSDTLLEAFDRIILAGDFGAVACLAAAEGQVEWIVRDPALTWIPGRDGLSPETPARPAVYHRGRLHAVQHNDQTLQQLDARTGATRWSCETRSRLTHIAGVRGGIVVAGGQKLWGIDFDSGTVRWSFGFEDPGGAIAGEAVLAGETVYACTRTELFALDLASGAIQRRIPLQAAYGVRGGRLQRVPGGLLVISAEELVALKALD